MNHFVDNKISLLAQFDLNITLSYYNLTLNYLRVIKPMSNF